MSENSSDVNPLDVWPRNFVARHRAGERPSLDEFIARRPDLADNIRDLFPGLVLMEGVRPEQGDATGPSRAAPSRRCGGSATTASCARSAVAVWASSTRPAGVARPSRRPQGAAGAQPHRAAAAAPLSA